MPDQGTIILYALSTLAQTCAALAAFVGAVGIFRLQILRERRGTAERNIRGLAREAGIYGEADASFLPIEDIIREVERNLHLPLDDSHYANAVRAAGRAATIWRGVSPDYRRSRLALFFFEAWNLLVIFLALLGFNYFPAIASWSGTRCALGLVAVVTVLVTFWCVVAWTTEGRRFSETLRDLGNRLRRRLRL